MIIDNKKIQGMPRESASWRREWGFTLIEIIIYVALVGIILLGLVYFLIGVSQTRAKAMAISEVQSSQRLVFSQMRRLIKSSTNINWSLSQLNNHPGVLALTTNSGQVIFVKINTEGYLVLDSAGQVTQLSNNLVNVSQLIFRRLDDQTVGIDLVLNYLPSGASTMFDYSAKWQSAIRLIN